MRRVCAVSATIGITLVSACGELLAESGDDAAPNRPTSDPTNDGGFDAGGDATAPVDGGSDSSSGRCHPTAAFGAPQAMPQFSGSTVDETNITLSPDELTAYLGIGPAAGSPASARNLFGYRKESATSLWEPIADLDNVSSGFEDDNATVSGNGLILYFHSARTSMRTDPDAPRQIFVVSRSSASAQFPLDPAPPGGTLNASTNNIDPYLLPDNSALYWSSDRFVPTYDIYVSRAQGGGIGLVAERVAEVSLDSENEASPVVSPDELEIFFARSRPENPFTFDIWHSTRASTSSSWGAPVEVPGLSQTTAVDVPTWISPDHCVLYFSSDRTGSRDIFVATRGK